MTTALSHGSPVPQSWRCAFLTLSTWSGAVATALELQYALDHWSSTATPEAAVATLKHRRRLERQGLLRIRRTAEGNAPVPDNEND